MSTDFNDHGGLVRHLMVREDEAAVTAHAQFILGQGCMGLPDKNLPEVIERAKRIVLLAETLPSKRAAIDQGAVKPLPPSQENIP